MSVDATDGYEGKKMKKHFKLNRTIIVVCCALSGVLAMQHEFSSSTGDEASKDVETSASSTKSDVYTEVSCLDNLFLELLDPAVSESRKATLLKYRLPSLKDCEQKDEGWFPVFVKLVDTATSHGLKYRAMCALWRLNESAVSGDVARYLLSFAENKENDLELRWLAVQGLGGFKENDLSQGLSSIAMRGSPLLSVGDFQDIREFRLELCNTNTPVSAYLLNCFSPTIKEMMLAANADDLLAQHGTELLIGELNRLLVETNFYEVDVFKQDVNSRMTSESRRDIGRYNLLGEIVRLNRALLEAAYPDAISSPSSEELSLRSRAVKALKQIDEKSYIKVLNLIEKSEPTFFQSVVIPAAQPRAPKLLTSEQEREFRDRLSVDNEDDVFVAIQALSRGREPDTIEALMEHYRKTSQKNKGEIALTLAKIAKRDVEQKKLVIGFLERVQREETDALLIYCIEKLIIEYMGEPDRGKLDKLYADYLKTLGYESVPEP